MTSAGGLLPLALSSLPQDILDNIGSWLSDQEVCNLELTSKALHKAMSNPRNSGPSKACLELGARRFKFRPPDPKASRLQTQLMTVHLEVIC